MSDKQVVFISHLSEEKPVALELKALLDDHLGDAVQVYVSSDDVSIRVGERWLESISRNLKSCVAAIILCSPTAITRHWIHFEAGAVWIRDILVMPVCFGGVTARSLPDPLRQLQAVDASNVRDVAKLVRAVADAVKTPLKRVRGEKFVKAVKLFESGAVAGPAQPKFYQVSADIQNELPQLIRSSRKSLVMCGIHFNISLGNRFADYLSAVCAGVSLTISAVRPESNAIEAIADFSGEDPACLRSECGLTYAFFDRFKRSYAEKRASAGAGLGRLILQLADRPPVARAYLFDHRDPRGQLLYTPYLRLRESTECPTLQFHSGHPVFAAFVESSMHQSDHSSVYFDSQSA
jgi:hypothetical protein